MPHVIWFSGLSGSGKTTLADKLADELRQRNLNVYRLDGDVLREELSADLGYSTEDRIEQTRRAGAVAKILADAGIVVIASFITPAEEGRQRIRNHIGPDRFFEVFVDCPIEECEKRDVKGLYKKFRAGEISEFTGLDLPYEPPAEPTVHVRTHLDSESACLEQILTVILPMLTGDE